MRKGSVILVSGLAAFIVIVIGNIVIVAQDKIIGNWKADTRAERNVKGKDNDGKINISFERVTKNGRNQNGSSFKFDELQGLTRENAENEKVNFRLVREAGTIDCEGTFTDGRGSGTFRFTPNNAFVDGMRLRGFDFEGLVRKNDSGPQDRLLTAALVNVTTALADDLLAANFGRLGVEDLLKAAIFKIDGKFMAEMKATGFTNLRMEDLVKARIFKIDAKFVRQVRDMGFDDREFESLVKFRIFKVTPEYLNELKAAGLSKMDSEDIVKCRIFKIDPEFVRKARATDPNVTVEDLVKLKIGVYKHKDKDSY
jgi:hypothetical protein